MKSNMKEAIEILESKIEGAQHCIETWKGWGITEKDTWEGRNTILDKKEYIEQLKKAVNILKNYKY